MTYLNDDEILIVDTNNDRIQQTSIQTGTVVKTLGKEGLGIGDFDIPGDVCLDEERRVVVTEFWNSGRQVISRVWKKSNQDGQLNYPSGLLIDSSDNLLVCDQWNNRVQQFSLDGRFTGKSITHLSHPRGVAATPDDLPIKKFSYQSSCFNRHLFTSQFFFLLLMARTVSFLMCNNRRLGFVSLFFFSKKLYQIQPN